MSDVTVLLFIAVVVSIGAMVMQQVRGEDHRFEAGSYLLPFVFVVIPSCVVIGSAATLFDALRPLRGAWGSVVWFFAAIAATAIPLANAANKSIEAITDVFGLTPLLDSMSAGVGAALPLSLRGNWLLAWMRFMVRLVPPCGRG